MYFIILSLCIFPLVTPAISLQVLDQIQNEGATASFTCCVTSEPVSAISWYFNDNPVDVTNAIKYTISMVLINTTTISNALIIMNVESSDVGTYTCNASNLISSDTSSGVLTVNGEFLTLVVYQLNYLFHDSCTKHYYANRWTTVKFL